MSDNIHASVYDVLGRFNPEGRPLEDTTDLGADLNIDSVAAMDVIMEIEDRFEIDIPINQVSELRTVGDLVALTRQQIEAR